MRKLILIVLVLFMPFWCGCVKSNYPQYQVKVVDAEENVPVEGAKVSTNYIIKGPAPQSMEGITNRNGFTELGIVTGLLWGLNISADGYIPLNHASLRKDFLCRHEKIVQNDNELMVLIYKKPEPKIEVVVPDGYRGPVSLEIKRTDKLIKGKAGQRVFSYKMIPNATVTAQISPLFYGMDLDSIITIRYENGNVIPSGGFFYRSVSRDRLRWKAFVGSGNDLTDWLQKRTNQNNGTKEEDVQLMFVKPASEAVLEER